MAHPQVDIVHASVLNPIRHPRVLYRQALTQQRAGFQVAVVAQGPVSQLTVEAEQGVRLIGLPRMRRLSLRRLIRPWQVMRQTYALQPKLVHLHTPELLIPAILLRPKGVRLVYDVHEDYALNIQQTEAWPIWLRGPLAWLVRQVERWAAQHVDAVTYAELAYGNLLNAPDDKAYWLLNRYAPPPDWPGALPDIQHPVMLYTGTLAAEWGVQDAVHLWDRLNHHQPVHLVVAASGDERVWQSAVVQMALQRWPERWTRLGENGFVPHSLIMAWVRRADFGLALYHPLPHLRNKLPSKFYEFMAAGTPLVYRSTSTWEGWNTRLRFGLGITKVDDRAVEAVLLALATWFPEVNRHIAEDEWSWEAKDAPELLRLTEGLTPTLSHGENA